MPDYRAQTDRIKDKIERARTADPAFLVFGAPSHRYEIGPPLDEREVAAFEESYQVSLPACFRTFLTAVGHGGPVTARVVIDPRGHYPLTEQEIEAFEKNNNVTVSPEERRYLAKIRNGIPVDRRYAAGPDHGLWPLECCVWPGRLRFPPVITPDTSASDWAKLKTDLLDTTRDGDDLDDRLFGGLLSVGPQGCAFENAIIVGGPHAGRVVGMNVEEMTKPDVYRAASFLDWYECWLDEVLSDSPPRAAKNVFDYRRVET